MSTLHVTNGDCAANVLRQFLADPVIVEADPLHEGPAPSVDDETWLDLRARFLAGNHADYARIREDLGKSDRALEEAARYERVVLWFEHDLFDQLQIVRTLSRLARQPGAAARTRMICIDRFPERFVGNAECGGSRARDVAARWRRVVPPGAVARRCAVLG